MADIIYLLCAITSTLCAFLLLRGYRKTKVRLLLWSGLCFAGLALNNILLVVDLTVYPNLDMSTVRSLPAALGIGLLVYGLVWDSPA